MTAIRVREMWVQHADNGFVDSVRGSARQSPSTIKLKVSDQFSHTQTDPLRPRDPRATSLRDQNGASDQNGVRGPNFP